jgi:septum formation protein
MLVLASGSPRRQELLRNAGIPFMVHPADIDETPFAGEFPRECAKRLAREKALTVHRHRPQDYVLGADTVVVVNDAMLSKPRDPDDAARMLRLLSGRTHQVTTGVCLITPAGYGQLAVVEEDVFSETTVVTMRELSEEEINAYVTTGDSMDKAGAYGIQGIASRWIPRIEGDYNNVMGLPVAMVYERLRIRKAI